MTKTVYPLLAVLSISCGLQGTESLVTLTPSNPEIWENTSLTLSCYTDDASTNNYMYWQLNNIKVKMNGDQCQTTYFPLNDTNLYKLRCQGGKNFSVTILKVDKQHHGNTWQCIVGFKRSNIVTIFVSVPVQSIDISLPNGNIIEENQTLHTDCTTSFSRPLAVIQWFLSNGTSELNDDIRIVAHAEEIVVNRTVSNETFDAFERSNILSAAISKLTYTVNRWMNEREIYCAANNSLDRRVISTGKTLNITHPPDGPPYIEGVGSSETYSVINKRQEQLTCVVMGGNPIPSLNWNCATNATQTTTISNNSVRKDLVWTASIDNTGICTCQSTYKETIATVKISIHVLYPPNISNFSLKYLIGNTVDVTSNISVIEHTPFALTCDATGNPSPSYLWSGPFSSSDKTFIVQNIERGHEGNFTCIARNNMQPSSGNMVEGKSIKNIFVSVLYPPTIGQLKNTNIPEGMSLDVTCPTSPGNPYFTRYIWTNKDKKEWHRRHLSITNITRTDDGEYRCTAYNIMEPTAGTVVQGNASRSFRINVLYKASVVKFFIADHETQQYVIINEYENVRFICDVDSNPGATITLYYETSKRIYKVDNTNRLQFVKENFTCSQSGLYSCTGKNVHNSGQPSLAVLSLQVRCPPRRSPETGPTTINARLYASSTLSFTVTAYPEPGSSGFVCYKQNISAWSTLTYSTKYVISSSGLQSNLTMSSVTESDYGEYMLRVENTLGKYEQNFSLLKPAEDSPARKEGNNKSGLYIVIGCLASILLIAAASVLTILGYRRYKKRNTDNGGTNNSSPYSEVSEMHILSGSGEQTNNEQAYETMKSEGSGGQTKNEQAYETLKSKDDIGGIQTKAIYSNLVM